MTPPLMTSSGLVLAASRSALATAATSPVDERDAATGPTSMLGETVDAGVLRRRSEPACSCTPCTRRRRAQLTTQGGQLADAHAAVLGDEHRVGGLQLGRDLVDHGDLLWRGFSVVMYTSSRYDSGCSHERTPRGAKGRSARTDDSGEQFTSAGWNESIVRHPGSVGIWASGLRRATG